MKDIQGIQRGKCNSCECEEYRTVAQPQGGSLRCEYCNHTPAEHVRIIELGACKDCGQDECDKYQSEDPNSYTDCGYCGCKADRHAGADKLRKPTSRPASQQGGMVPSGQGFPQAQGGGTSAGFQPRQDAYGHPVQKAGSTCKYPGCKFPQRVEGGKVHDFCSRTCAKKYNEMQSAYFQQKKAAAQVVQQQGGGPPQGLVQSLPPPGGNPIPSTGGPSQTKGSNGGFFSSIFGPPSTSGPPPGVPQASTSGPPAQPMSAGKLCTKCQIRSANPGRSWCQQCFQQSNS